MSSGTPSNGEEIPQSFRTVPGVVFPFGTMELAITESGEQSSFLELLEASEKVPLEGGKLDEVCRQLRSLVFSKKLPEASLKALFERGSFLEGSPVIVRSSSNLEDLLGSSGAGLYDSVPVPAGIWTQGENGEKVISGSFLEAVSKVWASLYSRRAVLSRRSTKVKQSQAKMAVLVQPLLAPAVSFVVHTDMPAGEVSAELALGQGETLASGARGTPWRLSFNKNTKKVETLAFANFSQALVLSVPPQRKVQVAEPTGGLGLGRRVARYSLARLSNDDTFRESVGQKLGEVGIFLEKQFGKPQDIEGCFVGEQGLFIVQSRPQV